MLGYSAAALDDATRLDVFPKGAKYTKEIDPFVFKKPGIFRGDESFDQFSGNLLQRNDYSPLQIKLGD